MLIIIINLLKGSIEMDIKMIGCEDGRYMDQHKNCL
jgi:hypothetical protein